MYVFAILFVESVLGVYGHKSCNGDKWALTFDDGPSISTPNLLDILAKNNIKATFFVVGQNIAGNESILKRAFDEGHEIGIHTWSHPHLNSLSRKKIIEEVESTRAAINAVIGQNPKFFRAPFGEMNQFVFDIVSGLGYEIIYWNRDSTDAVGGQVQTVVSEWVADGGRNAISLNHDLIQEYVDQIPEMLSQLKALNLDYVKVSDCIGIGAYGESKKGTNSEVSTKPTATSTIPISTTNTDVPSSVPVTSTNTTSIDSSSAPPDTNSGTFIFRNYPMWIAIIAATVAIF